MQLPDAARQVRSRFIAAFPVPQGAPGEEFEERARQWTIKFAEQVAFDLPNQGWGMKRADPNRPISKDTIARLEGGRLLIWDLLTGTGTGAPRPVENPESEDITGQFFVEVTPTNHLKGITTATTLVPDARLVPPPPVAAVDAAQMVEHLAAIRQTLEAILKEQQETRAVIAKLTAHQP